jgi:TonB family protein
MRRVAGMVVTATAFRPAEAQASTCYEGLVMKLSRLWILFLVLAIGGCRQQRQVYVKHVEPPSYPRLARMTRIRGTVKMLVTIGQDGRVLSVQSEASNVSPLLRDYSEKVIKDWTFGCSGCSADSSFTHTIKFVYVLDDSLPGDAAVKMDMDLPGLVTMSAGPVYVNPSTATSKKESD